MWYVSHLCPQSNHVFLNSRWNLTATWMSWMCERVRAHMQTDPIWPSRKLLIATNEQTREKKTLAKYLCIQTVYEPPNPLWVCPNMQNSTKSHVHTHTLSPSDKNWYGMNTRGSIHIVSLFIVSFQLTFEIYLCLHFTFFVCALNRMQTIEINVRWRYAKQWLNQMKWLLWYRHTMVVTI